MWKATLRGLIARRLRLALTLAAIVLGVAFVSATYVLTDTLSAEINRVFLNASAGVDVTVRSSSALDDTAGLSADRARMPAALLTQVQQVPGVEAADGVVIGFATIIDAHGHAVRPRAGPGIGISWPSKQELGPLRLRTGRPPSGPNEMLVDQSTADEANLHLGDVVRVVSTGAAQPFRIVGTMTFGDAQSAGPTLASFDTATAQQFFQAPGLYDAINVAAQSGVNTDTLIQRMNQVLPPGVEAVNAADAAKQDAQSLQNVLNLFEGIVLVFAGVGVFVGAFLIFNTFGVLVAQRVRELGLLRALGADPAQVRRSVLGEAALVGLIGGAFGLVAGLGLATLLMRLLGVLGVGIPSGPLRVSGRTIVVALGVGLLVTMLASSLPARRASRISPIEALSDVPDGASWRRERRDAIVGIALFVIAVALFVRAVVGRPQYQLAWFGLAGVLLYLAISALAPFAARPVARGLGAALPPVTGVSGVLARENTLRNARRTATTAATLMVGVSLMSLTAIVAASASASIGGAVDQGLHAELVMSGPELFPFSTAARDAVAANPNVATAASVRLGNGSVNGAAARVAAVDPVPFSRVADLAVQGGSLAALQPGEVLVHEGVARDHNWHVGDTISMGFARTGNTTAHIAGIFKRNQLVFASYVIPMSVYEAGFGTQLDSFVYVQLRPDVSPTLGRTAVGQAVAPFPTVEVNDRAGFSGALDEQVHRLVGIVWALLALAVLTGVLGIVNTLALSVIERTREIGLLRTVGMARRQVRLMIGGEAVLIALVGALLGIGLGCALGWMLSRILSNEGVDVFAVPWIELVVFFVLAGAAGLVASALPAWRASRLSVLDAIAHE
jgi:putative ABC transport system permease protein